METLTTHIGKQSGAKRSEQNYSYEGPCRTYGWLAIVFMVGAAGYI